MAKIRRPKLFAKIDKPKKSDLECIQKMQVEVKQVIKKNTEDRVENINY